VASGDRNHLKVICLMSKMNNLISTLVAQFPVKLDIQQNLDVMLSILSQAEPGTLVILPEGALSGYAENPSFLDKINQTMLAIALQKLREATIRSQVHLIFGSCLFEDGKWYNAGLYYGPQQEQFVYRKINLAISERTAFAAGTQLSIVDLDVNGRTIKVGIQLCREIRFPEQWQYLARAGAEVFVYLTNAIGDVTQAQVWRSHLISRAAENQRFVLCANNAHTAQKCPSMIVTPEGKVVWEMSSPTCEVGRYKVDVSTVSNWYLSQARLDLITSSPR
jgi:predicted amidohydrolase